jgi:hypothetical protein
MFVNFQRNGSTAGSEAQLHIQLLIGCPPGPAASAWRFLFNALQVRMELTVQPEPSHAVISQRGSQAGPKCSGISGVTPASSPIGESGHLAESLRSFGVNHNFARWSPQDKLMLFPHCDGVSTRQSNMTRCRLRRTVRALSVIMALECRLRHADGGLSEPSGTRKRAQDDPTSGGPWQTGVSSCGPR